MDPVNAVQKAIYEALTEVTVSGVAAPIFDEVPDKQAYPYIVIDSHNVIAEDNLVENKSTVVTYLSVWSEYRGQKQVLEISGEVFSRLHRQKFVLDSGTSVITKVLSRDTVRDQDDETFMGRIRVETLIEH